MKQYVVCRPGMKQAMEAAFTGLEVVVEDGLKVDYEFRERELTGIEAMEEELEREERQEADPKNAQTFIVPLATQETFAESPLLIRYLAVRVERNSGPWTKVGSILKGIKLTTSETADLNLNPDRVAVSAVITNLRGALQDEGFNILSISEAEGLDLIGD